MRAAGFLLFAVAASAADFPQPHNSEQTPGSPMPAEEAAAKWQVPPGFKVSVFAAEPDVQNPIACAWDPRGRLWVAENYTYAERTVKWDAKLRDRVLILEDTDGDGRHDKRTVFADDVQHLTSVEVGLGGVWVLALPHLLFIPDKNGDDRPDGPAEVMLDGFKLTTENHHNCANGLRWGPDGWLYGRSGASSPARVGVPGTPDAERVPVAGGMWRFHPQRKVVEALCSGTTNPWGHDWNEEGECFFTNTVNGHLWHMIPGAHYVRAHTIDTNPHSYELIDMIADHWHFDTAKGWAASRDGNANDLGGGHAHCGAMIYLGDNWPDSYRGKLYTLNFHGRRMNVERLERQGSGYVGRHDDDAFFSADPWFRGIDLTYGPDGGVFVLDWSDTGECHESTGVHRTSGRIYKITYEGARTPDASQSDAATVVATALRAVNGDLAKLSNAELVKLHEHRNEWFVRMARRVLVERATESAESVAARALDSLFKMSTDAAFGPRAKQTLHAIGVLGALEWATSTRSTEPGPVALRALTDDFSLDAVNGSKRESIQGIDADKAHQAIHEMSEMFAAEAATTKSAAIRLALASSLQRFPFDDRSALARSLVTHAEDANDHNIPLMVWYGIIPLAESRPNDLVEIASVCELPTTRRLITRRLSEDIEKQPHPIADLLALAAKKPAAYQADILAGLAEGFTGWRKAPKPASWEAFVAAVPGDDEKLQARVRDLSALFGDGRALDEVKRIALDKTAKLDARRAALRTLIDNRPDDLRAICEQLLGERFVNAVAARGLALFDDPAIGAKLAKSYRSFHATERKVVIDTLVSRPAFARALLEEIAAGKIPREDISAFHARQIRSFNDPALSKRLAEVWGEMRESPADKRVLLSKLKMQLTPAALAAADKSAGRVVYESICASCHTLYGRGGQIGPDLTGSGRANLDYLLENIVDPGAVVNADMRLNVLTLKDGRVLNGVIGAKTDRTLTLKTATEAVTIERAEIVKQEEIAQSMMPEGLLLAFGEAQVRDLIAYLMHPVQVPLATETAPK
ncbi:MAG: PVC-type heme-binding CxxCH protein [Chthoniobacteraceae bacterium]